MSATTMDSLTSKQLCQRVNMSYRQLDYLCRLGLIPRDGLTPGSGSKRAFDRDITDRLHLAAIIRAATPLGSIGGSMVWPTIVKAVMDGPQPPQHGFVVWANDGTIRYMDTAVFTGDVEIGALVVRYSLT